MRIIISVIAILTSLSFTGCGGGGGADGDIHQRYIKELAGHMREMAAIFQTITDEASAKEAAPKIEATRAKMRAAFARAKALPTMSAAEAAAAEAVVDKELFAAMDILTPARTKLNALMQTNPQVKEIIEAATQGMENDMK